jgi:protein-tyrosine phosphatase
VAAGERDEFDVVVICSGNRFRSPIAEGVLRGAAAGLPVRVRSMGTLDLRSGPVLPEALDFGHSFGLDLSEHRSSRLAGSDLSRADLVIGFEPIHVSSAVVDAGADRGRAFLLTELVDAVAGLEPPEAASPVERARAVVRAANEERARSSLRGAEEIADPIGGPAAGFRATGERVRELTLRLAEKLFD